MLRRPGTRFGAIWLTAALAACAQPAPAPQLSPVAVVVPRPDYDPGLVRGVQKELIRLSFLHDVADGVAGPKTTGAIRQFEHTNSLLVDGAPTQALLARLQATPTAQAATATPPPAPAWVQPTQGNPPPAATAAMAPAAQPGGMVAPTPLTPAAAPGSPGWVAPTTSQ